MIVYSKEKLLPSICNVITLSNSYGYFYLYQDTYDECVLLKNKYALSQITNLIGKTDNINYNKIHEVREILPTPLSILAPFITLANVEMDVVNVEQICGVLSVIATSMSLLKFIESDQSIRKRVDYTEGILDEYQLPWRKFFNLAFKWSEIEELTKPGEIHPRQETVPYLPLYTLPANFNMAVTGEQVVSKSKEELKSTEPRVVDNMVYFDEDDESESELKFETLEDTLNKEANKTDSEDTSKANHQSNIAGFNPQEDLDDTIAILKETKSKFSIR